MTITPKIPRIQKKIPKTKTKSTKKLGILNQEKSCSIAALKNLITTKMHFKTCVSSIYLKLLPKVRMISNKYQVYTAVIQISKKNFPQRPNRFAKHSLTDSPRPISTHPR